ncbi:MAG: threonine-phosphate decarboxylase, partial [Pseudomonadota bacterium]
KDEAMTAKVLKESMCEENILIRTAEGFNGLSEYHFRLAVKDRLSNEKLLKAMKKYVKYSI